MDTKFGGDDQIGYAGAIVFAAGGVTRENLEDGTVLVPERYSGGVLTKSLILIGNPVDPLEAATKSYVDSSTASHAENYSLHVTPAQRALLDGLTVTGDELNALHGLTANVDVELARRLERAGDTMTGPFTLAADPVDALQAATKQYVDNKLAVDLTNLAGTKVNKYGDTMTGYLFLSDVPQMAMHAVPKAYVDILSNAMNARVTTTENSLTVLNIDPVTKTYVNAQDALKVSKAGDTMTGHLSLVGDPVVALHAATKSYVDGKDALRLSRSGDTISGPLTLPGNPTQALHAAPKQYIDASDSALDARLVTAQNTITSLVNTSAATTYVDSQDALKVAKSGDTMAGPLVLAADPSSTMHAANKRYVDTGVGGVSARTSTLEGIVSILNTDPVTKTYVNTQDALKLPLAGGTLTGGLILAGAPTQALHAVTKTYVDVADTAVSTRTTLLESSVAGLKADPTTKAYVDTQNALKVAKAGDVMTGALTLSANPTAPLHAATKQYVDTVDNTKANKTGETFTGPVILSAEPVSALQAATKSYVDVKLNRAGDTMTGALTLFADPVNSLHAATKRYVDTSDAALNTRMVGAEASIDVLEADPTTKGYVDSRLQTKLSLSGGVMSGSIVLSQPASLDAHAVSKGYVDTTDSTLSARISAVEGVSASLMVDPVTKTYVNTQDTLKVAKVGDTLSGALILHADPVIDLQAAPKRYVDTCVNVHANNATLHLTPTQNTLLDSLSANSSEVNYLVGVTNNVQTQLDSKLPLNGGTLSGNLVISPGSVISINTPATSATDAVNKAYVDALIQGLKWKDPLVESNLIACGLNEAPLTALKGYAYIVGETPSGVWSAFANRLVTYNGTTWVDVLGRAVAIGDRLGVGFEVSYSELDSTVFTFDNRIVKIVSLSPVVLAQEPNNEFDTTLVSDSESVYYGSTYTYTPSSGWVKVSSVMVYQAGAGLRLTDTQFSINFSSGLEEVTQDGQSKLRAKLNPSSAIIFSLDGVTSSSDPAASLSVATDTTSIVTASNKLTLNPTVVNNINGKVDKTGAVMTGLLTLSGTPTSTLHAATKGYVDGADASLNTRLTSAEQTIASLKLDPTTQSYVDSQVSNRLPLTGGTLTGALTLSGAPVSVDQAATKGYVDVANGLKVAKAGDTMSGLLTLSGDPTVALHAATKQYADTKLAKTGGTLTGVLVLNADPVSALQASTKQYVDNADAALSTRLTTAESSLTVLKADPTTKAYVDAQAALKLNKSGDSMTGALTLVGNPTVNLHATTKAYVDAQDALKVSKAGDTLTGALILATEPTAALQAATKSYVDTRLNRSGDTLTGMLTLFSGPTAALHAATKAYVDSTDITLNNRLTTVEGSLTALSSDPTSKTYVDAQIATRLALSGGTMTGLLTLSGTPTTNNHATTKQYVDNADASLSTRITTTESNIATVINTYAAKTYVDAVDALKLNLSGGVMTGMITLSGAPTIGSHPTTKTYVDSADAVLNTRITTLESDILTLSGDYATTAYVDNQDDLKLNKYGDTMLGSLTLNADPTASLQAATKQYVDNHLAASTTALVPSWNETTNNQVGNGWTNYKIALDNLITQNRNNPLSTLYAYTPNSPNFPTNSAFTNGVLLSDGSVFFAPLSSTSARIYNIATNTLITPSGSYPGNNAFCAGIMLKDGRVFMAPWYATSARIYNPYTNSLSTPAATFGGNAEYCDAVLMPDGRVFMVPFNKTTASVFNPVNNTLVTVNGSYPGSSAFSSGVLMPDGRIFCVPYQSTTARIYDPVSNTTTTPNSTYPGNYAYTDGVVLADGRIFMVPYSATSACIYDPVSGTLSTPPGAYPGNNAFISGELLMDGRVFMTPNDQTNAVVFDPYTGTLTTLPDTYTKNAYTGSTLLPDGKLMIVPTNVNRCRIVNATQLPVPMAICTSPFTNKK